MKPLARIAVQVHDGLSVARLSEEIDTSSVSLRELFQVLRFDLVVPLHAPIEEALQPHANSKPRDPEGRM